APALALEFVAALVAILALALEAFAAVAALLAPSLALAAFAGLPEIALAVAPATMLAGLFAFGGLSRRGARCRLCRIALALIAVTMTAPLVTRTALFMTAAGAPDFDQRRFRGSLGRSSGSFGCRSGSFGRSFCSTSFHRCGFASGRFRGHCLH